MGTATRSETLRLLAAYSQDNDAGAREQLVTNYVPLVRSICWRFRRSREPQEDLFQVGLIGLLNAIDKFDPRQGTSFSTLAIPEVLGAILNYLRDHSNLIKVPRKLRRNKLAVDKASDSMAPSLGHWPSVHELAERCDLSEDEINEVIMLTRTGDPRSLDERIDHIDAGSPAALSDFVGFEDSQFEVSLDRIALAAALNSLPVRERMILKLKFYQGLSQRQIAEMIDVSQMHVSRLERAALVKLRMFMQRSSVQEQADASTRSA